MSKDHSELYYLDGFGQLHPVRHRPVVTNADKIRQMSDEELAEAFAMQCRGRVCKGMPSDGKNDCVDCWLDWLKQEVRDGDAYWTPLPEPYEPPKE